MREIVFCILGSGIGHFNAVAVLPSDGKTLKITSSTLEDLHHEAREALIEQVGDAHCTYQVRLKRQRPLRRCDVNPPFLRSADFTTEYGQVSGPSATDANP